MANKDYWFVIRGKVLAPDYDDAMEQIRNMAIVGKNCERAIFSIDEASED